MQNRPVICLMGPTASGKTDIAIKLHQRFPMDIISVDSALVYRGMNIGTAKPDAETLAVTPHRLIDIRDPEQAYSAGDFVVDVQCAAGDERVDVEFLGDFAGRFVRVFVVHRRGATPIEVSTLSGVEMESSVS